MVLKAAKSPPSPTSPRLGRLQFPQRPAQWCRIKAQQLITVAKATKIATSTSLPAAASPVPSMPKIVVNGSDFVR
jgi:hypothetical protein